MKTMKAMKAMHTMLDLEALSGLRLFADVSFASFVEMLDIWIFRGPRLELERASRVSCW